MFVELDIDECEDSSRCHTDANCQNIFGSFVCTCFEGYSGDGSLCFDIDECEEVSQNSCHQYSQCNNLEGSYNCSCISGYQGDGHSQCDDINECAVSNLNECDINADCLNTDGSYSCLCSEGFEGDGLFCQEIDECLLAGFPCQNGATCVDDINRFYCECTTDYKGAQCEIPSDIPMCPSETDEIPGSELFWNATDGSYTNTQNCPPNILGLATRQCNLISWDPPVAEWEHPDLSNCLSSEFLEVIDKLTSVKSEIIANGTSLFELMSLLRSLTLTDEEGKILYPADLIVSVKVLDYIANSVSEVLSEIDIDLFMQNFVEAVSNTIQPHTLHSWINSNNPEKVFVDVKTVLDAVELTAKSLGENEKAERRKRNTIPLPKYSFQADYAEFQVLIHDISFYTGPGYKYGTEDSYIFIPKSAFSDDSEGIAVVYTGRFSSLGPLFSLNHTDNLQLSQLFENPELALNEDFPEYNFDNVVNGGILVGSVYEVGDIIQLDYPVVLSFQHQIMVGAFEPKCVFLNNDESESDSIETWDSTGCEVYTTDSTHTVCHCYHLTSFAVLMDLHNMQLNIPNEPLKNLSTLSYIGSVLSIIGCVLALVIYRFLGLKTENIKIYENLAVSSILCQFTFIIGIDRYENLFVCKAFAALLHYFLLSTFCWMLVTSFHLYTKLVKVFTIRKSGLVHYCSFAWGIPFAMVAISFGVFRHDYSLDELCWLSWKLILISFIPQIAVILLLNIAVLIATIKMILNSNNMQHLYHPEKISVARASLRTILILILLFGTTWIFGYISISNDTLVYTYLFSILNSFTGMFFFIGYCVFCKEVKNAFDMRYGRNQFVYGVRDPHARCFPRRMIESPHDLVRRELDPSLLQLSNFSFGARNPFLLTEHFSDIDQEGNQE